jgi:prephenate dehydrogenase
MESKKRLKRIAGIATKKKKKVFVIGTGLIGGSMVLDIKKCIPRYHLWNDTNDIHLQEAIALGVIDAAGS